MEVRGGGAGEEGIEVHTYEEAGEEDGDTEVKKELNKIFLMENQPPCKLSHKKKS